MREKNYMEDWYNTLLLDGLPFKYIGYVFSPLSENIYSRPVNQAFKPQITAKWYFYVSTYPAYQEEHQWKNIISFTIEYCSGLLVRLQSLCKKMLV